MLGKHLRACDDFDLYAFRGDVTRREHLAAWQQTLPPLDAMLHLAAVVPVARVDEAPDRAAEVNVGGTRNVIEALHAAGQTKVWLFYASTAHVYQPSSERINESHPIAPITIYGETKLRGERVVEELARQYDMPYCIGRIFSYTSPWQARELFIPNLCERIRTAAAGAVLPLRGGSTGRDFLTAEQIVSVVKTLTLKRHTGTINVGSGNTFYVRDVAIELKKQMGRDDVTFDFDHSDASLLIADVTSLRSLGVLESVDVSGLVSFYLEGLAACRT